MNKLDLKLNYNNAFEAGRQSAQKEIDDLKLELERKEHLINSWISECGKKENLINFLNAECKKKAAQITEKQEQVRKLKEVLISRLARGDKEDVDDLIDEIFPDCADNCQEGKFCAKHGVTHTKEELV